MSRRWSESDLPAANGAGAQGAVATRVRRGPNRQLEYDEQKALMKWCELQYFRIESDTRSIEVCLRDRTVSALNGSYLQNGAIQWRKLEAVGALKNFPDLMILVHSRGYGGMLIEMKKQRRDYRCKSDLQRAVRPGQAEMLKTLGRGGYYTCIAYGWVDAAIQICNYMKWDARAKGLV